jgi:hypothetical protein
MTPSAWNKKAVSQHENYPAIFISGIVIKAPELYVC